MMNTTLRSSRGTDRIVWTGATRPAGTLDFQAAAPGVRRLRGWARDALAVEPGEQVLEAGCGTGDEILRLAAAAGPTGTAIGVDANDGLLALARLRARATGSLARFVPAETTALPFDDATFDAVLCEGVLQHLPMPEAAVAELARVLRPGGRVVLIDSDWSTAVLHPGDPDVLRRITGGAIGGLLGQPEPYAGRKLRSWLTGAGLEVIEQGSQALITDYAVVAGTLVPGLAGAAVAQGLISGAERDRLVADLAAGAARDDFHSSVTMFGALARRPQVLSNTP
jgi:SAM-dependent methyltransferase